MSDYAIIGGTGLTTLDGLTIAGREVVRTPWGEVSDPLPTAPWRDARSLFWPVTGSDIPSLPTR